MPLQLTYPLHLLPTEQRLEHKSERDKLFEAIVSHGNVSKAAAAIGMVRQNIYRYSHEHKEFAQDFLIARAIAAEALYDECISIADDENLDPRARHIRIETRIRVAGKLIPRLSDRPPTVNIDNRQITVEASDPERARLIKMREDALAVKDVVARELLTNNNQKEE